MKNRFLLLGFAMTMLLIGGSCLFFAFMQHFGSQSGTAEQGTFSEADALLAKLEQQKKQKPVTGVGAEDKWMTRYELTDRTEKKIGTQELAGQLHVVSFFFASCPGSCRQQNMHFAELEREFGKDGVKFVAITCDPDTDTPAKLREYAAIFNAPKESWYFLTGELPYIQRVAGEVYGVHLDLKSHVEKFLVVDKQGKVVDRFAWADAKEFSALKTKLRELVADKSVTADAEPATTENPNTTSNNPSETNAGNA